MDTIKQIHDGLDFLITNARMFGIVCSLRIFDNDLCVTLEGDVGPPDNYMEMIVAQMSHFGWSQDVQQPLVFHYFVF